MVLSEADHVTTPDSFRPATDLLFSDEIHLEDSTSKLASVELILALFDLTKQLFYPGQLTSLVKNFEKVDEPFVLIIVGDDSFLCGSPFLSHCLHYLLTLHHVK